MQTQIVQTNDVAVAPELNILPLNEFVAACVDYNQNHPEIKMKDMEACPVHVYASQIHTPCRAVVPLIDNCPVCGEAMCPQCGSHHVEQLSRVTGYIQATSGWNSAKLQELQDRRRYALGNGGGHGGTEST